MPILLAACVDENKQNEPADLIESRAKNLTHDDWKARNANTEQRRWDYADALSGEINRIDEFLAQPRLEKLDEEVRERVLQAQVRLTQRLLKVNAHTLNQTYKSETRSVDYPGLNEFDALSTKASIRVKEINEGRAYNPHSLKGFKGEAEAFLFSYKMIRRQCDDAYQVVEQINTGQIHIADTWDETNRLMKQHGRDKVISSHVKRGLVDAIKTCKAGVLVTAAEKLKKELSKYGDTAKFNRKTN